MKLHAIVSRIVRESPRVKLDWLSAVIICAGDALALIYYCPFAVTLIIRRGSRRRTSRSHGQCEQNERVFKAHQLPIAQ
jgi:hypothetical protein